MRLNTVARWANNIAGTGCAVLVGVMLGLGLIGLVLTISFGSLILGYWR